jgi:hypothetical protein
MNANQNHDEITLYPSENGDKWTKVTISGSNYSKGNSFTLLVGILISPCVVENDSEITLKFRSRTTV